MKAKKNKKIDLNAKSLKKSLGELMKDEDGFVSKENILKVGLSTVAALGVTGALIDNSSASMIHTNTIGTDGPPATCAYHTNQTVHSNY